MESALFKFPPCDLSSCFAYLLDCGFKKTQGDIINKINY